MENEHIYIHLKLGGECAQNGGSNIKIASPETDQSECLSDMQIVRPNFA